MITYSYDTGKFSSGYGSQEEVQYGTPQFVDGIENAESAHCSLGFTGTLLFRETSTVGQIRSKFTHNS